MLRYSRTNLTVLDYFRLGLQRSKHSALPVVGEAVHAPAGLTVRFQLRVEQGVIQEVSFAASTCVTLVAYCEVLAQMAIGMSVRDAVYLCAEGLADSLVGVPTCKRDRAWLAAQGMRHAVLAAIETSPPPPCDRENQGDD